jgi:hypothetical protein
MDKILLTLSSKKDKQYNIWFELWTQDLEIESEYKKYQTIKNIISQYLKLRYNI